MIKLILPFLFIFISCTKDEVIKQTINPIDMSNFYTLKVNSIDGDEISMSQYKGKKIVILNVASKCGFTPQYADWENFYKDNNDKVVVLGFPCNQFSGQEPDDNKNIKNFCQNNYGVTFPMFAKIDVKDVNQSPLYKWLTDKSQNGWNEKVPTWNFCKYLISEKGELLSFFESNTKPTDPGFLAALKK
jgi:glutathione peroxidase